MGTKPIIKKTTSHKPGIKPKKTSSLFNNKILPHIGNDDLNVIIKEVSEDIEYHVRKLTICLEMMDFLEDIIKTRLKSKKNKGLKK
jgi:hypothetical protein